MKEVSKIIAMARMVNGSSDFGTCKSIDKPISQAMFAKFREDCVKHYSKIEQEDILYYTLRVKVKKDGKWVDENFKAKNFSEFLKSLDKAGEIV